jgi:hypothetical protein
VVEIGGILESRFFPVQILHPSIEFRIIMSDRSRALEMARIDRVVSDNRGVQSDVRFGKSVADEVILAL